MRGIISEKLKDFIGLANIAAEQARADGIQLTPLLVRENIEKLAIFIGEGPDLDYVKEMTLATSTHTSARTSANTLAHTSAHISAHSIDVRVYSPDTSKPLPVVLHFHGGGHMCGNIALYDPISRKIAKEGNCIVIAVDYRLAPEHPFPAGIEDCQFVLEHYQELLTELPFTQQLIIAGDSAGGAICTSLASNNIHNADVHIDKQILVYPSVDYSMSGDSIEENGTGFLLEKAKMVWYFDNYFQHNEPPQLVSPLFMPMAASMPETIIFTAGCDPLRDEGIAYGNALKQLGVNVEQHTFDGMIHAYMLLDSLVKEECKQTYQLIGAFIRK